MITKLQIYLVNVELVPFNFSIQAAIIYQYVDQNKSISHFFGAIYSVIRDIYTFYCILEIVLYVSDEMSYCNIIFLKQSVHVESMYMQTY